MNIFNSFKATECALKKITIRELDSYVWAGMVGRLHQLLEFLKAFVLKLAVLLLLTQEFHDSSLPLCFRHFVFVEHLSFHSLSFLLINIHKKFLNVLSSLSCIYNFDVSVSLLSFHFLHSSSLFLINHILYICWVISCIISTWWQCPWFTSV